MSEAHFAVRETAGSEILRYGSCPSSLVAAQAGSGEVSEVCAADVTDETHYHNGTAYVVRPDFSLVYSTLEIDTTETLNITGIPTGTAVTHPGGVATVNDGYIDWSCVEPGTYEISFINFPYKPVTLNATVIA